MSVSADPHPRPGAAQSQEPQQSQEPKKAQAPQRPLVVTGGIAAAAAAGSGLAVLITLTAIGWITAPHVGIGSGLAGVLRTAALLWLVAHHVGVTVRGAGRIGLLPLGLVLLPGALLAAAGRWVVRAGRVTRLRHVGYAAVALALPYALLAGALALACRTAVAAPSLLQALVSSFLLALVAGGLGAARGLAPWSRLTRLMPARPRSVLLGMLGSSAILTAAGAALAAVALATHLAEMKKASDALGPGAGGAALLLLAELAYVPNAIIWAVSYLLGPGFAFGVGTIVAPTGSSLGAVPAFPMLAALPGGSRTGDTLWVTALVLAWPYLAGVFAGIVTVRVAPTPMLEAAPLWGFAAGAGTGVLAGLAATFAGGPLGDGRLAAVGPSGIETGLVAVLEIGISAALAAAAANWLILRRATRPRLPVPPAPDDIEQPDDIEERTAEPAEEAQEAPGDPGDVEELETPPDEGESARILPFGRRQPATRPGMVDETDDADGHRIYFNPWAGLDDDQDEAEPDEAPVDDYDYDYDD